MSLDSTKHHPGYRLGRLFAVLEKIQEEASPASTPPSATVITAPHQHPGECLSHTYEAEEPPSRKLESKGRVINLEKLTGEIMEQVQPDFPNPLAAGSGPLRHRLLPPASGLLHQENRI